MNDTPGAAKVTRPHQFCTRARKHQRVALSIATSFLSLFLSFCESVRLMGKSTVKPAPEEEEEEEEEEGEADEVKWTPIGWEEPGQHLSEHIETKAKFLNNCPQLHCVSSAFDGALHV